MNLNNLKIGQQITGQTLNFKGERIIVSGEVSAINDDIVYIVKKFPKKEYFAINKNHIITGEKDAKENK